jgi:prepilin-type processing-associated H-X9-DG protein
MDWKGGNPGNPNLIQSNLSPGPRPLLTPRHRRPLAYEEFHLRPPKSGKNVAFMDGHVTLLEASFD